MPQPGVVPVGGQHFIIEVLDKIRQARAWRDEHGRDYDLEVDGGLNAEAVGPSVAAGANMIVSGSSVFKGKDATAAIRLLESRAAEVQAGGLPDVLVDCMAGEKKRDKCNNAYNNRRAKGQERNRMVQ